MTEKAPERLFYRESLQSKNSLIVSTVERTDEHDIEYVRCKLQRLKDLERVAELVPEIDELSISFNVVTGNAHARDLLNTKRHELRTLLSKLNVGGDGN